jgi:hypothetical protein
MSGAIVPREPVSGLGSLRQAGQASVAVQPPAWAGRRPAAARRRSSSIASLALALLLGIGGACALAMHLDGSLAGRVNRIAAS